MKKYSISVISKACGVKTPTLRIWEKRYGAFSPERSDNGRRQYTQEDYDKALILSKLLDLGFSISEIANESVDILGQILEHAHKNLAETQKENNLIKKLFEHLENYELDKVNYELQHLRSVLSVRDFIFKIALPSLRKVDAFGAKGKYSVSQEHIISIIIRNQLEQLNIPDVDKTLRSIALATPDGNIHELSILFANIICKLNQVSTYYLGASHPADSIGEALNSLKTSHLILGVASYDEWSYEEKIKNYLQELDSHLDIEIVIVLGGGWKVELPKFKNISNVIFLSTLDELDKWAGGLC